MMSYKKTDDRSIRELIPYYVKGELSIKEQEEVKKALIEDEGLRKELKEWEEIYGAFKLADDTMPQPSDDLYRRIKGRIRKEREDAVFKRLKLWFAALNPSPAFSLAVIAVQLVIIVAAGIYITNQNKKLTTLSESGIREETKGDIIKINVVFRGDASEEDIRKALLSLDARIIDGPHASGLYIIAIKQGDKTEDVLKRLRESGIVILAERRY